MGGLQGVPEELAGFGYSAVDFAIEATGDVASDPVESTQKAGIAFGNFDPSDLGGLESRALGEQDDGGLDVDLSDRRVLGAMAIGVLAVAWYAGR
jgi:hypothetical protein